MGMTLRAVEIQTPKLIFHSPLTLSLSPQRERGIEGSALKRRRKKDKTFSNRQKINRDKKSPKENLSMGATFIR
jgi:hypothetical protein